MTTHSAALLYGPGYRRLSNNEINARVTIEIQFDDLTKETYSVPIHIEAKIWSDRGLKMRVQDALNRALRTLGGRSA